MCEVFGQLSQSIRGFAELSGVAFALATMGQGHLKSWLEEPELEGEGGFRVRV